MMKYFLFFFLIFFSSFTKANILFELDSSPFNTHDAPLPEWIYSPQKEKIILIDPNFHHYGAYSARGKLIRWGIATTGAQWCRDIKTSCETSSGLFRIYSVGDESCTSNKYPYPDGGAPMPYCMFFHGGQAIHGSDDVTFANASHGCIRVHREDAKWLHDHFIERPHKQNNFRGTLVIIKPYQKFSLLRQLHHLLS